MKTLDEIPLGVAVVRDYGSLTLCLCHHPDHARRPRVGYPGDLCAICMVTSFDQPVKFFVTLPKALALF